MGIHLTLNTYKIKRLPCSVTHKRVSNDGDLLARSRGFVASDEELLARLDLVWYRHLSRRELFQCNRVLLDLGYSSVAEVENGFAL